MVVERRLARHWLVLDQSLTTPTAVIAEPRPCGRASFFMTLSGDVGRGIKNLGSTESSWRRQNDHHQLPQVDRDQHPPWFQRMFFIYAKPRRR